MSPRIFLGLVLCNLVWSANPVMGKLLLRSFPPVHASLLRYVSALLAYVLFIWAKRTWSRGTSREWRSFFRPARKRDWGWLIALGFFTFCFSPFLQMSGLEASRAVDNSLIIAMEPLITVLIAWMFLRERLKGYHVAAFALALAGFSLLTGITPAKLSGAWDPHLVGNLLMLASLAGEGAYSSFARILMARYLPTEIFGSSLAVGTGILACLALMIAGVPDLSGLTFESVLGLLWLGPLGTTITYLFWMMALSNVSIASMALTLFIQPVVGSFWGMLFLDERLTQTQSFGALLILLAVSAPALREAQLQRSGPTA